jgi:hypothetical protein
MKKIIPILSFISIGFVVLTLQGCSCDMGISSAEDAAKQREVSLYSVSIMDFDSGTMKNNLNGDSGTWEANPLDEEQSIKASLDPEIKRAEKGASLKLEYDVDSPEDAVNGFWTQIRTFDASAYDHFEFWVKGDKEKGYPEAFKIEFKKFEDNISQNHDKTIKGSYVVKGVTDEWQKVSVPLNVMNGILDWHDIREFVITFENRRLACKEGVVFVLCIRENPARK